MVKLLVTHGANLQLRDKVGVTTGVCFHYHDDLFLLTLGAKHEGYSGSLMRPHHSVCPGSSGGSVRSFISAKVRTVEFCQNTFVLELWLAHLDGAAYLDLFQDKTHTDGCLGTFRLDLYACMQDSFWGV